MMVLVHTFRCNIDTRSGVSAAAIGEEVYLVQRVCNGCIHVGVYHSDTGCLIGYIEHRYRRRLWPLMEPWGRGPNQVLSLIATYEEGGNSYFSPIVIKIYYTPGQSNSVRAVTGYVKGVLRGLVQAYV